MNTAMNRETWLNLLAEKMAPRFQELGYPVPAFRVSIGFTGGGKASRAAGEVWHSSASADNRYEILITPDQFEPLHVAAILAHELAHAGAGFKHQHKGNFAKCVAALGLIRPFTSSVPGPVFEEFVKPFLAELGPLPHAPLAFRRQAGGGAGADGADGGAPGEDGEGGSSNQKKKQTTRLVKCTCAECGYTVRVTRKWLEIGAPGCPSHGAMVADETASPAPGAEDDAED